MGCAAQYHTSHKLNALQKAELFTLVANISLSNEQIQDSFGKKTGIQLSSSYISQVRAKANSVVLMGYTRQLEKVLTRKAKIYTDTLEIIDCATRALLKYIRKQEKHDLRPDDIKQVLYIVDTVSRLYAMFEANKTHTTNVEHNIRQYTE